MCRWKFWSIGLVGLGILSSLILMASGYLTNQQVLTLNLPRFGQIFFPAYLVLWLGGILLGALIFQLSLIILFSVKQAAFTRQVQRARRVETMLIEVDNLLLAGEQERAFAILRRNRTQEKRYPIILETRVLSTGADDRQIQDLHALANYQPTRWRWQILLLEAAFQRHDQPEVRLRLPRLLKQVRGNNRIKQLVRDLAATARNLEVAIQVQDSIVEDCPDETRRTEERRLLATLLTAAAADKFAAGQVAEALLLLRKHLPRYKETPELAQQLARFYYQLGDYRQAIEALMTGYRATRAQSCLIMLLSWLDNEQIRTLALAEVLNLPQCLAAEYLVGELLARIFWYNGDYERSLDYLDRLIMDKQLTNETLNLWLYLHLKCRPEAPVEGLLRILEDKLHCQPGFCFPVTRTITPDKDH